MRTLLEVVPYLTKEVKIVVDPSVSKGLVQINGIALEGSTLPQGKDIFFTHWNVRS